MDVQDKVALSIIALDARAERIARQRRLAGLSPPRLFPSCGKLEREYSDETGLHPECPLPGDPRP